jgi:AraC-like DNA-binding protein
VRESTVAASIVIDMLGYLERQGHPEAEVATAAQLDLPAIRTPEARVPGSFVERLWVEGERRTGDPDLGLHMAEAFNPGALDILGYVILSCRTAREVLDRLARFAAILNNGLKVHIVDDRGVTQCRFEILHTLDNYLVRQPRHAIEAMAVGVTTTLGRLTSLAISPVEVGFSFPAPAGTSEHIRVFGPGVRFGASGSHLTFRAADLDTAVPSANPMLLEVFERHATAIAGNLDAYGPVGRRVVNVMANRVKGAAPAIDAVAMELAMSTRSIQRALQDEGTSYQVLLDDVRRELAIRHLMVPGTSATQVAFLTGFSEPSAFARAFRRWTGSTPGAYSASAVLPSGASQ